MCGITCSKYQITISELQHRGNATINSKVLIKSARLPQNLLSQRFKSMVESYKIARNDTMIQTLASMPAVCINSRQVPHHLRQVLYQLRHLNYCKFIILCEYLIIYSLHLIRNLQYIFTNKQTCLIATLKLLLFHCP